MVVVDAVVFFILVKAFSMRVSDIELLDLGHVIMTIVVDEPSVLVYITK
jgi:hypothetical protein